LCISATAHWALYFFVNHSLIASYNDITYKDFNDSVSFAVGDWQSVYNNEKITSYVTKFIGRKDINYDFIDF